MKPPLFTADVLSVVAAVGSNCGGSAFVLV
jgi:hypothetical protein